MSPIDTQNWPTVTVHGAPEERLYRDITALASASEESDGNPPLSEQTLVTLRSPEEAADVVVLALYESEEASAADAEQALAAIAVVTSEGDARVLELVVHPNYRNDGLASRLITLLAETVELSGLRAWSHGDHEAAAVLASRHGFSPVRDLWRMRLTRPEAPGEPESPADAAALPSGVRLRAYVPGADDAAWLAVNAAAFAEHAEQGSMTQSDLAARMAEDWFDPAGFLLAVRAPSPGAPPAEITGAGEQILGFHWTKVHPGTDRQSAIGEVYVVGVSPAAQGLGLGRALTVAGIRHLHDAGLRAVMLYVDADNTAAVSLYRALGFTRWDGDVMYAADAPASTQA